ncbi:MAG: hypothetical protein KJ607_01715 [Bacteroidetes bacterium]|nr:hypothetical protein [Bacteroidota bacterium]
MKKTISTFLKKEPWVHFNALQDLDELTQNELEVTGVRKKMLGHPMIRKIMNELQHWPGYPLKNHRDANHLIHKLTFLADLGITAEDPGVSEILSKILKLKSKEGPFQVIINIPKTFGGTGNDEAAWIICDAPLILYSLIRMGYKDKPGVMDAVYYLTGLIRPNGMGCCSTGTFEKFRGPGRKDDPCPYANLLMLRLFSQLPEFHDSEIAGIAVDCFFDHWKNQKGRKQYLFGIGSDFRQLKAPLVWYDILHVLDVLTQYQRLVNHPVIQEMANILNEKADKNGLFRAGSVYRPWKDWDFGQKREPSAWITFLVYRIFKRTGIVK